MLYTQMAKNRCFDTSLEFAMFYCIQLLHHQNITRSWPVKEKLLFSPGTAVSMRLLLPIGGLLADAYLNTE